MRRILVSLAALLLLSACHSEHVVGVYTLFWHSEKCHPTIWWADGGDQPPPDANPACEWKRVNPPPPGVTIQ
jgi:hypothetical protein